MGGRKKGRETLTCERNIDWMPLVCPKGVPGPQPRLVPWLGIEPVTFLFIGQHAIHWATPARALFYFLITTWLSISMSSFFVCFCFVLLGGFVYLFGGFGEIFCLILSPFLPSSATWLPSDSCHSVLYLWVCFYFVSLFCSLDST